MLMMAAVSLSQHISSNAVTTEHGPASVSDSDDEIDSNEADTISYVSSHDGSSDREEDMTSYSTSHHSDDTDSDSEYETETDSEEKEECPPETLTGTSAVIAKMSTEEKVFLDVTSMVIFVSDVCNGGDYFEFEDAEMKTQAEQERKTPVREFLKPYFDDCLLVTCDSALKNFMDFTKLLGGEEENKRAEELAKRLTVVPDNMSERFQRVIKRGRVSDLFCVVDIKWIG